MGGIKIESVSNRLEEIVSKFIDKKVPSETRNDFIVAAIHFNINLNACTQYDLMRIDHKVKELAMSEENKQLTTASIYSYILYRALNEGEIPNDERMKVKLALMGISTNITDYLTYRIDEDNLNNNLHNELISLGV